MKYPSDKFVMYAIVHDTYMKGRNTVNDEKSEHKFYNETIELAKRHVMQIDSGNERCEYYKLIAYSYKWLGDLKTAKLRLHGTHIRIYTLVKRRGQ